MLGQKEVYIATLLCFIITVTGQVNNLLLYRFCAERRGTDSDTGVRLLALWPQAIGYIDIAMLVWCLCVCMCACMYGCVCACVCVSERKRGMLMKIAYSPQDSAKDCERDNGERG